MKHQRKAMAVPAARARGREATGFTLIEMSIVLVVIGLIVGGVLVGQNLIAAAGVRATSSQIEKYNTAVNTFRTKYGGLPGDLSNATIFGFAARRTFPGQGDGNGLIQGTQCLAQNTGGEMEIMGESPTVWVDLSTAALIDGTFNTATESYAGGGTNVTNVSLYFPEAKLGGGNYIYIWNGGPTMGNSNPTGNSQNYFGLSTIPSIKSCANGGYIDNRGSSLGGVTVSQAYAIDTKMDDGLPGTGNVTATGLLYGNNAGWAGIGWGGSPATLSGGSWSASATSCFDNGGVSSAVAQYSLKQNGGSNVNCALSFQFQ